MILKNVLLNFKQKSLRLLGLDIRPNCIRMVELVRDETKYQIAACKRMALDEPISSDDMLISIMKNILEEVRPETRDTAVALPYSNAVFKEVDIPSDLSSKEIDDFLRFNLGGCFGDSEENLSFDCQLLAEEGGDTTKKVQLVAVKSEQVEKWRRLLLKLELVPKIIDIDACAIERAIRYQEENITGLVAVVNIDCGHVLITVLDDKKLVYTLEDFVGEKDLGSITQIVEQITLKLHQITSVLSQLPNQLILAGEKAMLPGLVEALRDKFSCSIIIADPFSNIQFSQNLDPELISKVSPLMLISFGLALRVGDDG